MFVRINFIFGTQRLVHHIIYCESIILSTRRNFVDFMRINLITLEVAIDIFLEGYWHC